MILEGNVCSGFFGERWVQSVVKSGEELEVVVVRGSQIRKSLKYGISGSVRILRYRQLFSVFGGFGHSPTNVEGKKIFWGSKISYLLLIINVYINIYINIKLDRI